MDYPPFAASGATGASEDDYLGVSADIRRRCGWHIWPRLTETVTVDDPRGMRDLILPTMMLHGIESGTVDGVDLTDTELADLQWTAYGVVGRSDGGWPWPRGRRSVVLTIDHGFDGEAPADLAKLCRSLAARANVGTVRRKSMQDRSVEFAIPDPSGAELSVIGLYRLR